MTCSRCGKRPAVVFVSTNNSADAETKGYCLSCAKELGIKPVEDLIKKMGLSEEDIDNVQNQMDALMSNGDMNELMESMNIGDLTEPEGWDFVNVK
jgi:protein-arginine kinase activator protein McsA